MIMESDTIAAISTPVGEGAISIVRLSGPEAIQIASTLFKGVNLNEVTSHTIHYGNIVDPTTVDIADEVMVSVMRAPKTFTCEDVVEINCHGGVVAVNCILRLVLYLISWLIYPDEYMK